MREALITFLSGIGTITIAFFIASIMVENIIPKIKLWFKRTNKIRVLCKHEYVDKFHYYSPFCTEYELECRLCGKRKKFIIYEERDNGYLNNDES